MKQTLYTNILLVAVIGVCGLIGISVFVKDVATVQIMSTVVVGFMGTIGAQLAAAYKLEKELQIAAAKLETELAVTKAEVKTENEHASAERKVHTEELKTLATQIDGHVTHLLALKEEKGFREGQAAAEGAAPKEVVIKGSDVTIPVRVESDKE